MVSRIRKRKGRQVFHRVPLKLAAASVLSLFSQPLMSANINIAQVPLAGVQSSYQPNIVLVPSVEYPTAGGAYSNDKFMADSHRGSTITNWVPGYLVLDKSLGHLNQRYQGYFDSEKCYRFVADSNNGYFYAVGRATGSDFACPGADDFSGNVLNWATMSALDIFRKTLTGGNRVYGTGVNPDPVRGDYAEGDGRKDGHTYLRRARFNEGFAGYGWGHELSPAYRTRMRFRGIKMSNDDMKRYLPHKVVDAMMSSRTGRDYGYIQENGSLGGQNFIDRVANDVLYFHNYDYGFIFARALVNGDNVVHYGYKYSRNNELTNRYLPVVVRVCDFRPFPGEDAKFCVKYGSTYKPEGLIQAKARQGARFAAFGYLWTRPNVNGEQDGGVLRSPMKYLVVPSNARSIPTTPEWDVRTGRLNPDPEGAGGGKSSGVINYINQFGDRQGYMDTDPSGELYYAAMRYLRVSRDGRSGVSGSVYEKRNVTEAMKDGFPVYYNWGDPLKENYPAEFTQAQKDKEAMCRQNTIIWIGDTNTHWDNNLPNWDLVKRPAPSVGQAGPGWTENKGVVGKWVDDDRSVDTRAKFEQIWNWEGQPGGAADLNRSLKEWQIGRGPFRFGHSPGGVAGLAYWAHITDTRPDIPGNQFQSNFIIDVLEGGHSKEPGSSRFSCGNLNDKCNYGNPWYWAAKYGGFDHGGGLHEAPKLRNPNDNPSSWKRAASSEENGLFGNDRMPKNFALGNNPENMISALNRAFNTAGEFSEPSQAAPTFTNAPGQEIDLRDGATTDIIATTYNFAKLTGDVIARTQTWQKHRLIPGSTKWTASAKLEAAFHNNSGYANRQVYVRNRSNGFVRFNTANKGSFASAVGSISGLTDNDVINYVLGDNSKEAAGTARAREKLLGTLVSPTVAMVGPVPADHRPNGCTYTVDPASRPRHYVVSANDGMVHVLDSSGNEKMALMISTALGSLNAYASPSYTHRYLNDGTPSVTEACLADGKAHSVAVGTAGKGGKAVYALDVTNLSSPGEGNLMWEFTDADDADLGVGIGVPYVAKNKDGQAIAIFNSGYNNPSNKGHIYILNVNKPKGASWAGQYQKIPLGSAGVGSVFVLDEDKDGIPEKLYAGDYDGNLWRVTYDKAAGTWTPSKLYESGGSPPITSRPAAQKVGTRTYVTVGTGQYMTADALDSNQQNYAYGFFDEGTNTISGRGQLLKQTIGNMVSRNTSALTKTDATGYSISSNQLGADHKGWYIELPRGQIVTGDASIINQQVALFQAVARTNDGTSCSLDGSTSFISVDLKNGGLFPTAILDTNGDGKVDGQDAKVGMVTYANNIAVAYSVAQARHQSGNAVVIAATGTGGQISAAIVTGKMQIIPPPVKAKGTIRRISWQEIF